MSGRSRAQVGAMKSPPDLIAGLWYGHRTVALTLAQLRAVMLHYGGDYLHLRAGVSHYLRNKRTAPGVYDVWLESRP